MILKKIHKFLFFSIIMCIELIICQNTCLNGGISVIRPTASISQLCICQKSYIGKNCEQRIDNLTSEDKLKYGCELRPCWIGSTCEDRSDGKFVCHCAANTYGDYCELSSLTNNDPCASKPCYNGGTCIKENQNSFSCKCPPSYSGPSCKINLMGSCASSPCQRDGLCVPYLNGTNDFRCQCPDWTIGKNCEVVFNPCSRVNCQNNGICLKKRTLAYECNCTSQYTGALCTQPLSSSCQTIPCAYGTCQLNSNGQYSCACKTEGYEGTYCELEKCNPTCKNGGLCQKDIEGNFYCECGNGFEGAQCEKQTASCFAGSSLVETMNRGHIKVSDLKKGDLVKSYDSSSNEWIYSKFLFYLHKDDSMLAEYLSIRTEKNNNLLISSMHLIPKRTSSNGIEYVLAKYLNLNDALITENGNDKIIDISKVNEQGAYAPLLESGTISVNNILSSCYANTKWHELVHFVFKPIITYNSLFERTSVSNSNELSPNGMYWYVELLQSFLPYIPLSSSFVYV